MYYKNCSQARAAGVTPPYRGEPGYAAHLVATTTASPANDPDAARRSDRTAGDSIGRADEELALLADLRCRLRRSEGADFRTSTPSRRRCSTSVTASPSSTVPDEIASAASPPTPAQGTALDPWRRLAR
ncbi:excalibur calcium-binding domain-containing protein [Rhodococcus ruber]